MFCLKPGWSEAYVRYISSLSTALDAEIKQKDGALGLPTGLCVIMQICVGMCQRVCLCPLKDYDVRRQQLVHYWGHLAHQRHRLVSRPTLNICFLPDTVLLWERGHWSHESFHIILNVMHISTLTYHVSLNTIMSGLSRMIWQYRQNKSNGSMLLCCPSTSFIHHSHLIT